ncbi:GAF domain-containing protein [Salinibacter sp. 10B]|uniref:GAF domain-containing protein n=1 Tax=Salinibacter sp. 10B TaxID=1923971 RepID=UPI002156FDEE|nr:GAF domain-containing protein [Salinibacter sp. 10B]
MPDSAVASSAKTDTYRDARRRIDALLDSETDWIAAMATVACELHHSFDYYDWTGFYRAVSDDHLIVGPYQGPHGCLHIDFDRGVCGAAARTRETQLWPDVSDAPDHIACQSSTQSEVVVPIVTPSDRLLAVLDVDSDTVGAFDDTDREHLERLCADLGEQFEETEVL